MTSIKQLLSDCLVGVVHQLVIQMRVYIILNPIEQKIINRLREMSFAKSSKSKVEEGHFYPPPGYYEPQQIKPSAQGASMGSVFNRGDRFTDKVTNLNPGPGSYSSSDKETIKKRLLQDANRRDHRFANDKRQTAKTSSDIKISSIPSIPKKSATRVYEELAPGILILHEEDNANSNVGPGSYQVNDSFVKKSTPAAKFQPQHHKKPYLNTIEQENQIKVPTMAQELREEKRLLYKQHIIKTSNVNKNDINSSDLCLETIILRERLLRGEQVPPPGSYFNSDLHSDFGKKPTEFEKPAELQALGGRQERFLEQRQIEKQAAQVGPGAYAVKNQSKKTGGVINKSLKDEEMMRAIKRMNDPGPGAYQLVPDKQNKQEPQGNYPPIFGSGTRRFMSAPKQVHSQTPGPGSYKIDKGKRKKAKYMKIRKDFYESQPSALNAKNNEFSSPFPQQGERGIHEDPRYSFANPNLLRKQKNTHYFKSKVDRFLGHNRQSQSLTGPGQYNIDKSSFNKKNTYNKTSKTLGYIGDKSQRFDESIIRPNLGPGTYYS